MDLSLPRCFLCVGLIKCRDSPANVPSATTTQTYLSVSQIKHSSILYECLVAITAITKYSTRAFIIDTTMHVPPRLTPGATIAMPGHLSILHDPVLSALTSLM